MVSHVSKHACSSTQILQTSQTVGHFSNDFSRLFSSTSNLFCGSAGVGPVRTDVVGPPLGGDDGAALPPLVVERHDLSPWSVSSTPRCWTAQKRRPGHPKQMHSCEEVPPKPGANSPAYQSVCVCFFPLLQKRAATFRLARISRPRSCDSLDLRASEWPLLVRGCRIGPAVLRRPR